MYCNKYGIEIFQNNTTIDQYGDPQEMKQSVKANISCDMQPYSTEKLQKDYGYDIEVTKRIFMDLDANIINLVEIQHRTLTLKDGVTSYEIRKIIPWDSFMEVMCYGI